MYILEPKTLGIAILALYAAEGVFVLFSPGSLRLQRPTGGLFSWVYNGLNLATTLLVTPLVAFTLMRGWAAPARWMGLDLGAPHPVQQVLGWIGLLMFVAGIVVICWSRVVLGRSFRLGAVPPEEGDRLIVAGPFGLVRHPMYTGVILFALGLGLVASSWVLLAATAAIALTFVHLIPTEEAELRSAYGAEYDAYAARTSCLLPGLY